MRIALHSNTNVPMSVDVWEQSSQPSGHGGIGMQKAAEIAMPVYISLMAASADMVSVIVSDSQLQEKVTQLSMQWQNVTGLVAPPRAKERKAQPSWSKTQAAQKAESILENADVISRSRLLAVFRYRVCYLAVRASSCNAWQIAR